MADILEEVKTSNSWEEVDTEGLSNNHAIIMIETEQNLRCFLRSELEISSPISFKAQLVKTASFSLVHHPSDIPNRKINHKPNLGGTVWIQWSVQGIREGT